MRVNEILVVVLAINRKSSKRIEFMGAVRIEIFMNGKYDSLRVFW
jgi:hypothetical protein